MTSETFIIDMCAKINEMNGIDRGISFTRIMSNGLIESNTCMPESREFNFVGEEKCRDVQSGEKAIIESFIKFFIKFLIE